MKNNPLSEVLKLSIAERILLVEEIWDSIAEFPEAVKLTPDQKKELDKRLLSYQENPEEIYSWDEVKSWLKNGFQ